MHLLAGYDCADKVTLRTERTLPSRSTQKLNAEGPAGDMANRAPKPALGAYQGGLYA